MASKLEILLTTATGNTVGELNKVKGALSGVEKQGGTLQGTLGKLSGVATVVGATAVGLGIKAIDMADSFEKAHATLETTVKNVGQNFDDFKGKVAATDKAMENLGFTNADTENALGRLTVATKNVQTSMQLMGLAADIARARNIDLQSATDLLVKVEQGRFSALSRIGVLSAAQVTNLTHEKDATQATKDAVQLLTNLYGGTAAANADTFAGKMQVLSARAQDLGKDIGLALIPIVEDLVGAGLHVVDALQAANDATGGFLGQMAKIGGIGAAVVLGTSAVVNALTSMATAAISAGTTIALFAATNPEVAGLLAIGAAALIVTQGMKDVHASTDDAIASMRKMSELKLQTAFVPLSGSMADVSREAAALDQGFEDLKNSGKASAADLNNYIIAAQGAGADTRGMRAELSQFVAQQQAAAAQQATFNAALDAGSTSIDTNTSKTLTAAQVAAGLAKGQKELQAAYDAANKSILAQYDALNKGVTGFIDARLAQLADKQAIDDYNKSVKDAKLSTDQHTTSLLNTEKQLIDTSLKTADAATANQHFATSADEAATKSQIQIQYLKGVENTLAPNSPLRGAIDGYIAQLESIKPNISTTINANTGAAGAALQQIINQLASIPFERTIRFTVVGGALPMKAKGGYVDAAAFGGLRSNMVLVGEQGPEIVDLPPGSFVHTASQTQAMLGGQGLLSGSGAIAANLARAGRTTAANVAAFQALHRGSIYFGQGPDLSKYKYQESAAGIFNPAGLPGNPGYHGMPEIAAKPPPVGAAGTTINVNIDARGSIEANWDKAGRTIVDALKKYQNANGALPVVVAGARAIRA